jgi:2-phospho-L-lactate guanylyltransferase (CobY/MobA/RfbA family)
MRNSRFDLYVSGEFPKEVLTDRKSRLEETTSALEREREGLVTHLKAQVLSAAQIQTIQEFAAKVRKNLEAMGNDFGMKRRLIEELDTWVTLAVEGEQRVIYARCMLGEQTVGLLSGTLTPDL